MSIESFEVSEGYVPGHLPMFYGQGLVILATLTDGDKMAEFTVNGEWRFKLKQQGVVRYDINNPGDITPDLEEALVTREYGDTSIQYRGETYELEWVYNNWFEVFTYRKIGGEWQEKDYEIDENEVGPTTDDIHTSLEESLKQMDEED